MTRTKDGKSEIEGLSARADPPPAGKARHKKVRVWISARCL